MLDKEMKIDKKAVGSEQDIEELYQELIILMLKIAQNKGEKK